MTKRKRRAIGVGVLILAVIYLAPSWQALWQTSADVVVRPPGHRRFQAPEPLVERAREHMDFAYLSQQAYVEVDKEDAQPKAITEADECPSAAGVLAKLGWTRWANFPPDEKIRAEVDDLHLRVQVWHRPSPPAVTVAFGGTLFHDWRDWRSNLRWFIPRHEDQYTAVVKRIGPAFRQELLRRMSDPNELFLKDANIYSTGHSLGGGLAQQLAYSLPLGAPDKRVTSVYAFDPSPVTGFYSVERAVRETNSESLQVIRTYERGEILAGVRLAIGLVYPPSAARPSIWNIRYNLIESWNPIAGHSIGDLACGLLKQTSSNGSAGKSAS